ncbi:MAG: prepilin-type N-terminal cleavage/methylation domain-containing protein [Gammaproteobacteria bacterium]|nr:prepilin-type N-terminal cleavage/methylation domain-containing protein [Gammaproteobacteria bacterium]MBU0786679.1 prepilin-type N-terminal cleavage/methylation domain-containing protein [Gammaproteobacteria bacterium]MBU0814250.1 prepilin-type N-terminal cleavage/methylation domain-containing protein [Gammaproteobacteria bacterium]MBU1786230.1 prepilin-type N-terminal cleavage/methylation domain-containing protein [Gammaproteobacteria bacterium]
MSRYSRRQLGFTLVELIIFIVVVSIGVAGIVLVVNTVVQSSADPMLRKQAIALADSIMEEVLQKEYEDPDGLPNVVESGRSTYDDVDDYNGISNAAFTDLPAEVSARYVIAIVVDPPATVNGQAMKRVRVTVTGGGESITATGYRGDY